MFFNNQVVDTEYYILFKENSQEKIIEQLEYNKWTCTGR